MKSAGLIKGLEANGWILNRIRGSQHVYVHPENPSIISVPHPRKDRGKGGFQGWMVGTIVVDPALMDDTVERVNITLPRRVLKRLDAKAKEAGESRSSYIAHMAIG